MGCGEQVVCVGGGGPSAGHSRRGARGRWRPGEWEGLCFRHEGGVRGERRGTA